MHAIIIPTGESYVFINTFLTMQLLVFFRGNNKSFFQQDDFIYPQKKRTRSHLGLYRSGDFRIFEVNSTFFSSGLEISLMRHMHYRLGWKSQAFETLPNFSLSANSLIVLTAIICSWNIKKNILPWWPNKELALSSRSDPYLRNEIVP